MSWQEFFKEPDIVKNASADDLDPSIEGALVVSGLRFDNPASTWVSKATIKIAELQGTPINKYASAQIDKACNLFGITDDMFQLQDIDGYSFIVKEAGMNAEFCIISQNSFNDSVQALFEKRANAPYTFCRDCAQALLDVKNSAGYYLDFEDNVRLQKMAGNLDFNAELAQTAIQERASYIRDYKGNYPEYQSLSKLASACSKVDRTNSTLLASEIACCVDEVDRKYKFMDKFAAKNFTPIEESIYLTHEESLLKEASEEIDLDGIHKITKRAFMIPEICDEMAKWASDNGYATTGDPDDLVDCVSSMSESLRAEFVELFG
jgi:hypothetical protein